MAEPEIPILDEDGLAEILARAAAERWTELALIGPEGGQRAEALILQGWPRTRVFRLRTILYGVPEALARLSGLTSLNLQANEIGATGAEALAWLGGLTSLDLAYNEIADRGAATLARLDRLTSLNLSGNLIGDAGAEALARLDGLTSLNLGANQIRDPGATALARLDRLTSLDLSRNQMGDAGARAILDAWADPNTSEQRRYLNLRDNGDLGGLLLEEVLAQTDAQALIAAWRAFKEAEAAGTRRRLNEAKLLVLGKGNVGKTSLVRYLTTGEPRDPKEPPTEGVRAWERIETQPWTPDGNPFTLNIWDFGGQEIYYGTHRYFLTARSLYLLVLDDRNDTERDALDWLRRIESHAEAAPVIVVINKCDKGRQLLRLDEPGLRERHPQIVAFVHTSCDPGSDAAIAQLRKVIVDTLADQKRLPDVHRPIPPGWWQVKEWLADAARAQGTVGAGDYHSLCEKAGILDENERKALLTTLHNLGTVVAHGLDTGARAVHRETTLLDPNWLTRAIYTILGARLVRDQNGEFSPGDLPGVLDPEDHPSERYEYIVELMQDEQLGLCLKLQDRPARYLLPAALPPSVPDLGPGSYPVRRRFRYRSLPTHLMARLMVQARDRIAPGSARWRDGVVLEVEGCSVLVRAFTDPAESRIDIALAAGGSNHDRRRALDLVEADFDAVHKRYTDIGAEACVPLPDQPEVEVGLEFVRRLAREKGLEYRHFPEGAKREYSMRELLEAAEERPEKVVEEARKPQPAEPPVSHDPAGWLASWQGSAVVCAVLLAVAAAILSPVPWSDWPDKLAVGLAVGAVTYLLVLRADPARTYKRLLLMTVPGGLAMILLGVSLQVGLWTPEGFVAGGVGTSSIWASVVAFLGVSVVLATADVLLSRSKP